MEISAMMSALTDLSESYESMMDEFEYYKLFIGHELPSLERATELHGEIDSLKSKLKINFNTKKGRAEYILHSLRELSTNLESLIEKIEEEDLKEDEGNTL